MSLDLLAFFTGERFAASDLVRRIECAPNQRIITQGERDRFLYVVESGQVRVTARVDIEGEHHISPRPGGILGPARCFGELNLFEAAERSALGHGDR